MNDQHVIELLVWLGVLALFAGVAACVLWKIRVKSAQQEPSTHDLVSKFQELHSQGKLSETEFRTIKTTLAARWLQEIKDSDESG